MMSRRNILGKKEKTARKNPDSAQNLLTSLLKYHIIIKCITMDSYAIQHSYYSRGYGKKQ